MSTDNIFQVLFALIGKVLIAGGGGAVVAYGLFQLFGRNWINQYFDKQLQQFKHDQQIELEQLRHEINSLFSRISKIHEKEFDVLPRAWQLLHEAHGATYQLVKAFRQWPDLDVMPEEQLDAFLASTRLAEFQKNEIKGCKGKLKRYQEILSWYELDDSKKAQIELNNYLAVNSIFMTEALRQQFREINRLLLDVIIHEQAARRYTGSESEGSSSARMERISEMFNSIEAEVQRRLRYEDA